MRIFAIWPLPLWIPIQIGEGYEFQPKYCIVFDLLVSWFSVLPWRFSEEGTPVSVDSAGVVRLLSHSFGTAWSPVCITKSNVGVSVVVPSLLVKAWWSHIEVDSIPPFSLLPASIPLYLTTSLHASLPLSLPPCYPAYLLPCLPASLPTCFPAYLPPRLSSSLTPSQHLCISPSLSPFLPASLSPSVPPCLPPFLSPCLPTSLFMYFFLSFFQMKNKSDNYWIVGLDETSQQIR